MVKELREACAEAPTSKVPAATKVLEFCKTPLLKVAKNKVPSVKDVRCVVARSSSDASRESAKPVNETPDDPCYLVGGVKTLGLPIGSIAALQSTFLIAATDVLLGRAQEALKQDIMDVFVHRVCELRMDAGPPKGRVVVGVDSLLKEACLSIKAFAEPDPAKRYASPLPGLTAIRSSFRADLLAVPEHIQTIAGRIRVSLDTVQIGPAQRHDAYARTVLALTAIQTARGFAAGRSPGSVLRAAADSLGGPWANGDAETNVANAPEVLALTSLVGVASTMDGAWPEGTHGALTPAEITARAELVIRATLVSCADAKMTTWPDVLRTWIRDDDCGATKLDSLLAPVNKLVQAFGEMPALKEFRNASGSERRAMVGQQVQLLMPVLAEVVAKRVTDPNLKAALPTVASLASHLAGEDYAAVVLDVVRADSLFFATTGHVIPPPVAAALSFASDVALASDADAMRLAIEQAIAPPNRYLAKRDSSKYRHKVWLNSYIGGVATLEDVRGKVSAWQPAAGVALPIGVEVATHPNVSVLLQLLDLGQVLNYRLRTDTNAVKGDPPDLTFQTVFSPGLFLALRPGKVFMRRPYAMLLGASYSPKLREVRLGSGEFRRSDALRVSFGLAVDVPILP